MGKQVESGKIRFNLLFCALYYIKILNENITNEMYTNKKQTSLCEGIIL